MLLTTDICLFLQTNYWVVRATRTRIRDIRCFLSGTFLFGFQKSWAWPRVGLLWAGALSPCRRSDKSVHSSIDTFSGALFGSCHTGQTAWDICCHFLSAFEILGITQQTETEWSCLHFLTTFLRSHPVENFSYHWHPLLPHRTSNYWTCLFNS